MKDISVVDIAKAGEGIAPYKTWSFALAVSASPDMDEETAYQITKAAMEDKTVQANALSSLKGVDLAKLTMQYATVPLHPGAARYFKEQRHRHPRAAAAEGRVGSALAWPGDEARPWSGPPSRPICGIFGRRSDARRGSERSSPF